MDWLGVGANVRPRDETIYYSWVGSLRNTKLYPFKLSADLGKGFSTNIEGLAEGKRLMIPYFFATVEKQLLSFPSLFSSLTQLSAYVGYGEEQMLPNKARRSRGIVLGLGIGF